MIKMKRKDALNHIRVEVAQNGKVTRTAMRIYIENRIGHSVFTEAVNRGMILFELANKKETKK